MDQNSVNADEKKTEDKADKSTALFNWKVAVGGGLVATAMITASIIYLDGRRRNKALMSPGYPEPTVENYSQTAHRYWMFAAKTFKSLKSTISDLLSGESTASPFPSKSEVEAKNMAAFGYSEDEIILNEDDI